MDQLARPKPRNGPTAPGEWTGSMQPNSCQASPTVEEVSGYFVVLFDLLVTTSQCQFDLKVRGIDIILTETTVAWLLTEKKKKRCNCGDNNKW